MVTMKPKELEKIVSYIRDERKRQGISQVELAEGMGAHTINEKTYARIERGERELTIGEASRLLEKLGLSLAEVVNEMDQEIRVRFDNHIEEIMALIATGDYLAVKGQYDALLKKTYYNKETQRYKQPLMLIKGILMDKVQKNQYQALEIILEAIQLSKPLMIKGKKKVFDIEQMKQSRFNLVEYGLMYNSARLYAAQGKREKAIEINYAILETLEKRTIEREIKRRIFPAVSFILSNVLLEEKMFREVLEIVTKGIEYCQQEKMTKFVGEMYCNKGEALYELGKILEGRESFGTSVEYFELNGEKEKTKIVKAYALNHFGIRL